MAQPGWYPDPQDPSRPRYWDGQRWAQPTAPESQKPRRQWVWFAAAMAAVTLLVVGLLYGTGGLSVIDLAPESSARPSGSQWDELSPSPQPSDTPSIGDHGQNIACPLIHYDSRSQVDQDGRVRGGGLSFLAPTGAAWQHTPTTVPWMTDQNSVIRPITDGWISNIDVGYVHAEDGFTEPRTAAEQFMSCMASSTMFQGYRYRDVLESSAYVVDGHEGWRLRANVYVDNQPKEIQGDTVDIVVLELGEKDQLSVFVSCATIDLTDNQDEVAAALESLRVE
ncbi:DUF2510 domain-containing protein [Tessaracoccus caeni]|uniref:DUF2510 domain-containing protein n=1 Tax=Tessaracoccus caeni TaxID=3031239 RepID=UPI0023DC5837|nr:DUF2510 domain-containing protein [Tessaracoccus caeni]MDF1486912.1 DUF2510 domain-containing protein [Tessaracoccus caeni]